MENKNICPKCNSDYAVRKKKILISMSRKEWHKQGRDPREMCPCCVKLTIDDCIKKHINESPLEQFVQGCFCDNCGIGFIPDEILV